MSQLANQDREYLPTSHRARAELMAAATAIANARAIRRGIEPSPDVLQCLRPFSEGRLYREVLEDAAAALQAVTDEREKKWQRIKQNRTARAMLVEYSAQANR